MENRPALKTALLTAAGIISGRFLHIPLHPLFLMCLGFVIAAAILYFIKLFPSLLQYLIVVSLILFGALYYTQYFQVIPKNDIRNYHGSEAEITCHLLEPPVKKNKTIRLLVEADSLVIKGIRIHSKGKLIVYTRSPEAVYINCGDVIRIQGQLKSPPGRRNPGAFDYRTYLAGRNIYTLCYADRQAPFITTGRKAGNPFYRDVIILIRKSMANTFLKSGGPRSLELLSALIIGNRDYITSDLRENFSKAGVVHVLAVSGLHVGFILLIFNGMGMLFRLNRTGRSLFTLTAIAFYVILTGSGPSVVRASLMGGFYILGSMLERKGDPLNLIGAAALVLLLINPTRLFDTGFQLSFSAVIAILYIYPRLAALKPFQSILKQNRLGKAGQYILAGLLVSLSAQVGTLPFTAFFFQRIPLLALFINLLAIPLAGLITALGFTTYFTFLCSPWLGTIYGGVNRELISFLRWIVSGVGNLPFSYIYIAAPALIESIIFFVGLILLLNLRNRKIVRPALIALLLLMNAHIWTGAVRADGRKLRYIQFDVGQGDAALLRLPRGKTILIDGGDRTSDFDNGARVITPYLRREGIRKLDLIIATHPHNDHIGGLIHIIKNFQIGQIIISTAVLPTRLNQLFLKTAEDHHIPIATVVGIDTLNFPGVQLLLTQGIQPESEEKRRDDPNNQSVVMKLHFGETSLLFMGDAEHEAEQKLLKDDFPIQCDIIKAGHHGSRTSSSLKLLKHTQPEAVIVSVGENNRYKHPSLSILARYYGLGVLILRTDKMGAIVITSDGKNIIQ